MKIALPELGEGISNVEIRDVLVKEGDTLSKDDPILILETEKASMEIPSEVNGIISKIYVKSGDTISPNDIILSINSIDEDKTEKTPFPNNNDISSEDVIVQNNINNLEIDENQVNIVCEPLQEKRNPKNPYEAQFSIPYIVASIIINEQFTLQELFPAALKDPEVLSLSEKVDYAITDQSLYPKHFSGSLIVEMASGERFEKVVKYTLFDIFK